MKQFLLIIYIQYIAVNVWCIIPYKIPLQNHSDILYITPDCSNNLGMEQVSKVQLSCHYNWFLETDFAERIPETAYRNMSAMCSNDLLTIHVLSGNYSSGVNAAKHLLAIRCRWNPTVFIYSSEETFHDENDIKTALKKNSLLLFHINTDIFLVLSIPITHDMQPTEHAFSLWEVYSFKKQLRVEQIHLSSQEFYIKQKAVRRENFRFGEIITVGNEDPDYQAQLTTSIDKDGNLIYLDGLCFHLLKALQIALNFTLKPISGEGWVEQLENGTWQGMARQVANDEADISFALSYLAEYRVKGLTFLTPVVATRIFAYFRQPVLSSVRDILMNAFSPGMWLSVFAVALAITITFQLFYMIRVGTHSVHDEHEDIFGDSVVYAVSAFTQQGWYKVPQTSSLRIVFLSSIVVSFVCYTALSATLVSNLATEVVPIRSLKDLTYSQITVLGDKWVPVSHHFIRDIYSSRNQDVNRDEKQFIDADEAIDTVVKTQSAFLTFFDGFTTVFRRHNYTDRFYCDTISNVPITTALMSSGMFINKGSPYKETFNHKIVMMRERGILEKWSRHYFWQTNPKCPKVATGFHISLGINDIFTAYIILLSGLLGSFLLLILEKCADKKFRHNIFFSL